MDWLSIFLLWSIIILTPALFLHVQLQKKQKLGRLPPGPPGWPLFGNMFDIGTMPHRMLAGLRSKYGDIVWLNLGAINIMVVLSAKAATELFKNHDLSFADRSLVETVQVHNYHKGSMILAPYGSYWRVLRKLCTVDMLVHKRIDESEPIRRKGVDQMLSWIEEETNEVEHGVYLARFVFLAAFNLFGNLMMSHDLVDPKSKEGSEFFMALNRVVRWSGHPNIADVFPWLRWLDPQGLRRKMVRDLGKALEIASGFVNEGVKEQPFLKEEKEKKDFLDVLLEFEGNGLEEPAKISEPNLNILILEIFMAGTDSTSTTTEWAMTEFLRNPKEMIKVKDELDQVVGTNRKVEEGDIDDLLW